MIWRRNPFDTLFAAIVLVGFMVSTAVGDQEREDQPKRNEPELGQTKMDVVGKVAGRKGQGRPRITNTGNVRTTMLVDRGRNIRVVEDPAKGILIEVIQHYGADQMKKLKDKYPELRDYIDLFPDQVAGHEIELTLSLKKKFQAPDAKRLKAKSLFAFGIYQRHVEQNGDHLARNR